MSAFSDALTNGTWFLEAAGGGYLALASQADPDGRPYLTTTATRATAAKFAFTLASSPTPTTMTAVIREVASNRCLDVNTSGVVVLSPQPAAGSAFVVAQRRPTILSLGWQPASGVGGNVTYDTGSARFTVGTAPQVPMLMAVDPPAGPLLWSRKVVAASAGSPATFGGYQVVAGSTPMLTCVETFTGRIFWEFGESGAATCPPVVSWVGRAAIVASGDTVHAVSVDTAEEAWTFTASSGVYARARAFGSQVFVCASYGVLHALDAATGTEQWRFPASGNLQGLYETPALDAGRLFFGAWDGNVYALDPTTGQVLWTFPSGDALNGVPLATSTAVFVGNDAGAVYALDPATGRELWTAPTDGIVQSRPARHGSALLVSTYAGTLYAFDAASGSELWSTPLGGPVVSDIAVADDVAYVTTTPGECCVVPLSGSGAPTVTTAPLGGPSAGSVNVFSGCVNATTLSGTQVSYAVGLRSDVRPEDIAMLLQASDLANQVIGTTAPPLPRTWTLTGVTSAALPGYGLALVATLRRPSDDAGVTVVAFGVQYTQFLNAYDPSRAALAPVPATIIGPNAPAGVCVTDSVLANYTAMRPALLGLIGNVSSATVLVTGQGQGGALATLCALDLGTVKADTPKPAGLLCVSFGSPPVGNAAFAGFFGGAVSNLRVVAPGDQTVGSLPAGWVHVPTQLTVGQGFPNPVQVGTVAQYAKAMAGVV